MKDAALHVLAPAPGMTILDLGCATGTQMIYCALQGATVYGIDMEAAKVAAAEAKLAKLGLQGYPCVGNAAHTPWGDRTFDAVFSSDFHEHLSDATAVAVLRECLRVLKPGARLVLKTPNLHYLRTSLWFKRMSALLRGRSPFGYVIPHSPGTSDPQHIGLIARPRLAAQLAEAGFLNWTWHYSPLRRWGRRYFIDVASTEIPYVRDLLCEDVFVTAYRPIAVTYFPD